MISILITAWKEQDSIRKCLNTLLKGIPTDFHFEVLLAAPDDATRDAAMAEISELNLEDKYIYVKDPGEGKPNALKMLMDKAKGDIWFFGDGDTFFGEHVIDKLTKHFDKKDVMAVTGRPMSIDSKNTMMEYFGHLLVDAAHHKRTIDLTDEPSGRSLKFVKKRKFFPVSGYIFAMRATDIRPPKDTLVEDAYFSYEIINRGGIIEYEPEALVYVKFPKTLKDYFRQKKRSVGGYVQLWEYGVVKSETRTRSFWRELEYFWFPITYAKNLKELFWSFMLYPIRTWLWVQIYWERRILKKDFVKTWVRIESTK
ncbi:glycosyltransferase [Candidatus Dojkabacteria bacterium]|uniref:Glycosyltransferase n=1 Tax=Candidatus Dojkabacteria bacterium TaxID=2099670 RepID=A0A955RME1_9BACT|nr:glycosyltransferase [Candidatus Dojkabacteria bacterium]